VSFLTQRLVTQFGKYSALKNLLDRWLKEKRDALVAALEAGEKCPARGPYLLELSPAEERIDWRTEFLDHLTQHYQALGRTERSAQLAAVVEIEAIEKQPREKHNRLLPKRNPNFRREVAIRLPA
jgi:hypothetical protein